LIPLESTVTFLRPQLQTSDNSTRLLNFPTLKSLHKSQARLAW
jgi:hypothetical protein